MEQDIGNLCFEVTFLNHRKLDHMFIVFMRLYESP
jgi:hypothetical protein